MLESLAMAEPDRVMHGMRRLPRQLVVPFAVIVAAAIGFGAYQLTARRPEQRRIDAAFAECRAIIREGEQGWGGEVAGRIGRLKAETSDKHLLASRLLAEPDGSLAAEGMAIVATEGFPGGDRTLAAFAGDTRWNYWLDNNAHWSRLCLAAWKLKRHLPLDGADRRSAAGYDLVLRSTFGVALPAPPADTQPAGPTAAESR